MSSYYIYVKPKEEMTYATYKEKYHTCLEMADEQKSIDRQLQTYQTLIFGMMSQRSEKPYDQLYVEFKQLIDGLFKIIERDFYLYCVQELSTTYAEIDFPHMKPVKRLYDTEPEIRDAERMIDMLVRGLYGIVCMNPKDLASDKYCATEALEEEYMRYFNNYEVYEIGTLPSYYWDLLKWRFVADHFDEITQDNDD